VWCGAWGAALGLWAGEAAPGRFAEPSDRRPLVISLDGPLDAGPAKLTPADRRSPHPATSARQPAAATAQPVTGAQRIANKAASIGTARPASLNSTRRAVHLSFVDEGDPREGPVVLRWRSPDDGEETLAAEPSRFPVTSEVRQAAGDDPSYARTVGLQEDLLSDPFGDRAVFHQPPADPVPSQPPPMALPPAAQAGDAGLQDPGPLPMPTPRTGNPLYNDQDCEAELKTCRQAREQLKKRSIRDIGLDISPDFEPETVETAGRHEQRRRDFLEHTRSFKDLEGQPVATGTLTDLRNGRVVIRTSGGQEELVPYRLLSDDDRCYVAAWWGIPLECGLERTTYAGRDFVPSTMTWQAPALCHKPLYFEEVQLERYGHSAGPLAQPALSGAHFFLNIATLPYHMGIHPPTECKYPLGNYRPGSCAPWLVPPIPLSLRGGLAEAGAIVGGVFVIP
jgi:hypothetical protein